MTEEERKKLELQQKQTQQQPQQQNNAANQTAGQSLAMKPSANVTQAQQYLQQQLAQKPGGYQNPYNQQMNGIMNNILNRGPFQYNPNEDAGWQAYKNLYIQNGQRAMQDTVAQQAALTGGYANSYAGAVGQQQYQQYLREMGAAMPQFMQMAADRYDQEGDDMRSNLGMLQQMDDTEYGRYRDQYGDWMAERDYLTGRYDTEYERQLTDLAFRTEAYNLTLNMLANGVMPEDALLYAAGMTPEQAKTLLRGTGGNDYGNVKGVGEGGIVPSVLGAITGAMAAGAQGNNGSGNNFWSSMSGITNGIKQMTQNGNQQTGNNGNDSAYKNTENYKALKNKYTNYDEDELKALYDVLYGK